MHFLFIIAFCLILPLNAFAQDMTDEDNPKSLKELIEETSYADPIGDLADTLDDSQIRADALKEAALSYGARGGLAKRTAEIRESLSQRESNMDRIYDFKRLLIPAPSGLLIEPPIISEGEDATLIETGGQLAAVADRIYNINRNARIVSSARNWRAYLEREWGIVQSPPQVLLPRNDDERELWAKFLSQGWDEGVKQADEIFQADLNKLIADYTGMIRYRKLLAQGIVSPPYALQIDRGVTGGGSEMRVGDRAVQITGPSELQTGAYEWQAVPR
jgi:defect-in-organelle-trafficking protein DotC